jgi:hypothetical protein
MAIPYSKESQLSHKRNKPRRATISELSTKETKRLYERSNGVCERCDRARGTDRAHCDRRRNHTSAPVAEQFAHLCRDCHVWVDGSRIGREWLLRKEEENYRRV